MVCKLLKEGVDLGGAISRVEESWQQSFSEVNPEAQTETEGEVASSSSSPNEHSPQGQGSQKEMKGITKHLAQNIADAMYATVPSISRFAHLENY